MKVKRQIEIETEDYIVGDKIELELKNYGLATATVQKIDDKEMILLFDRILFNKKINDTDSNVGGFLCSDLYRWLNTDFKDLLPEEVKAKIKQITIPSFGQIFEHDYALYKYRLEEDTDEQLPLMKSGINRVAIGIEDDYTDWYWLSNATKKKVSSANFAYVSIYGGASYGSASNSFGVRPELILTKTKQHRHPVWVLKKFYLEEADE